MASSRGKFKIRKIKWNSMRAANRIPEVALEQKLTDIRRFNAQFKRDIQLEEAKLWEYLYDEAQILKTSLAKHSLEDILEGAVALKRTWASENEEPLPYSETYRKFVIFKAQMMVKLFGRGLKSRTRPRYQDLYEQVRAPKERNQKSYDDLMEKHLKRLAANEKTLEALGADVEYPENVEEDFQSELVEIENSRRRSRAGSRVRGGLMQARPHHKRGSAAGVEADRVGSGRRESGSGIGESGHNRKDDIMERRRLILEALPPLVKPDRDVSHNLPPLDEAKTETELHLPEI